MLKETVTSRTPGIFSMMHLFFTRTQAYIIGRAAFFIPLTSTLPKSGFPPRTTIFSIYNPNLPLGQIYSFPYYPGERKTARDPKDRSAHSRPSIRIHYGIINIYIISICAHKRKGFLRVFSSRSHIWCFSHNTTRQIPCYFVYNVPSTALIQ